MKYVIFAVITLFATAVMAEWRWSPQNPVKVYVEPNENSAVLREIKSRELIVISELQKTEAEDWVKIQVSNDENIKTGFIHRSDFNKNDVSSNMSKSKTKKDSGFNARQKLMGTGISLSQNIRDTANSTLAGGQTIDFGAEYGIAYYPTLFYEFPSMEKGIYRIYASYRIIKAKGQVTLKLNGAITSQELMEQTQNSVSLGFLFRNFLASYPSFWDGYGMEISSGLSGEQDYTDGTVTDLKGNLPTNFFAQYSLGYQNRSPQKWYFLPEAKFGAVVNNRPIDINIELFANFAWPL